MSTRQWLVSIMILVCNNASAIETELLGVRLGDAYQTTRTELIKKYGQPLKSSAEGQIFDAFSIEKGTRQLLIMATDAKHRDFVTRVQVSGDKAVPNLGFLSDINIGMKEAGIDLLLPKGEKQSSSDGFTLFQFKGGNYSVETKTGVITSISIDIEHTMTLTNDKTKQLVMLDPEQAGFVNEELKNSPLNRSAILDGYTRDPLRGSCFRYPLRYVNGVYLADVNVMGLIASSYHSRFLLIWGGQIWRFRKKPAKRSGAVSAPRFQLEIPKTSGLAQKPAVVRLLLAERSSLSIHSIWKRIPPYSIKSRLME